MYPRWLHVHVFTSTLDWHSSTLDHISLCDLIQQFLIRFSKTSELCTKRKSMSPHLSQLNVAMAHRIILGEIICKSSNWQHIQRLKITILFRLERIVKCSYFILSTQNIKFYWFVMKIKTFLLPIWGYNRGSFPLGNKYFGVFILNGLTCVYIQCVPEKRKPINQVKFS